MKKVIAAVLFSAMSWTAMAQERVIEFSATCVSMQTLGPLLTEFKELPGLVMTTNREINGKVVEFKTVMFINYQTGSWTLAERVADNEYCITALGENIKPFTPE